MDKIIIAGQGIVGRATWEYLSTVAKISQSQIEFHDPSLRSFAKSWNEAGWCMICVNTDFDDDQDKNDDSHVFDVVNESSTLGFNGIYVLRSTVSLSTIDCLIERLGDRLAVFPEFVREKFWQTDCLDPKVMPVGGARAMEFKRLLKDPDLVSVMTVHEAMACKLAINGFLSTKVTFFNTVYDLCEKADMDFVRVRSVVESFPGIGAQHAQVPGPDMRLGYGGKCLPKDTKTLAHDLRYHKANDVVIQSVANYNSRLRDE